MYALLFRSDSVGEYKKLNSDEAEKPDHLRV